MAKTTELSTIKREYFILGPLQAEPSQAIKELCRCRYHRHPYGCPKADACDRLPLLDQVFDTKIYAGVLQIDASALWELRHRRHPNNTSAQDRNPILWQEHFRKDLQANATSSLAKFPHHQILRMPEGMGDNVFERLLSQGVPIEKRPDINLYMVYYICQKRSRITYFV